MYCSSHATDQEFGNLDFSPFSNSHYMSHQITFWNLGLFADQGDNENCFSHIVRLKASPLLTELLMQLDLWCAREMESIRQTDRQTDQVT